MSDGYERALRIHNRIKEIGVWIAGLDIVAIMLFICVDVIKRNITGSSIAGSYEIIQGYLMALSTFTAIPYAYSVGVMPRVDLIVKKVKPERQKIMVNTMLVLDMIIFTILTVISFQYALKGFANKTTFVAGTTYYPVYPFYLLAPVSFLLVIIEDIFVLIKNAKQNKADMYLGESMPKDIKQAASETVF